MRLCQTRREIEQSLEEFATRPWFRRHGVLVQEVIPSAVVKIRRQVADLRTDGVDIDIVIRKSHHEAADTVAAVADELEGDVIVCGTRGLGALSGAFLGSFTQRLLHVAPCPVLAAGPRSELHAAVGRATIGAGG